MVDLADKIECCFFERKFPIGKKPDKASNEGDWGGCGTKFFHETTVEGHERRFVILHALSNENIDVFLAQDLSEMMAGNMPLRVKEDGADGDMIGLVFTGLEEFGATAAPIAF